MFAFLFRGDGDDDDLLRGDAGGEDESVVVPFLAIPQVVFCYLFTLYKKDLSPAAFRERLRRKPYLDRTIPILIANWVVWIHAVSLVYLLPFPLPLPLMNLILTFWSVILIFFAKSD